MRADSKGAAHPPPAPDPAPDPAPAPAPVPELPDPVEPELFKRPASAESRNRAARSAVGARSSVGPPRKSSRK